MGNIKTWNNHIRKTRGNKMNKKMHEKATRELKEIIEPLVMDWMYKYSTPHGKLIITQLDSELVSGELVVLNKLRD